MTYLLEFSTYGETQIARELQGMGFRSMDAAPAFAEIGKLMMAHEAELFGSQGNTGMFGGSGSSQARDAEAKAGRGAAARDPDRDGRPMVTSLTEGGGDNVLEVDPQGLTSGTSLDYAAVHYKGSEKVPLPRRRPLDFSEIQRREYVKVIQRYIVEEGL